MLLIRHSVGSRLLYKTTNYEIQNKGNSWEIVLPIDEDTASNVLEFLHEINIFEVQEKQKTWYFSSNADITFQPEEKQLVIVADNKTVYPTE